MNQQTDIIIIGGGIAGGSLAAKIAPKASVVLLEAEDAFGYHSTGRSAAMYEPNYGNAPIRELTRASYDALETAGVLSPRGVLYVADKDEMHLMADIIAPDQHRELTIEEAIAMVPILRPEAIKGAALSTAAFDVDVDLLFQGFMRTARSSGAQMLTGAGATAISYSDGNWHVVTPKGTFSAPVVVNAAGAWADKTAQMAGLAPVGIQPYRRSVARLPAPGGHDISAWPMLLSASEAWYAKPDAGKWLVSPADADPVEPMDAWADDMVLAEGMARYQEFVTEEVTRVDGNWAGLRSFAPDKTPVVGYDPAATGFFWLAGQGGYGVQTSPALSDLAADLVLRRKTEVSPDLISALSPERFS